MKRQGGLAKIIGAALTIRSNRVAAIVTRAVSPYLGVMFHGNVSRQEYLLYRGSLFTVR